MEAVAIQQLTYREFREMEFDDNDSFQYMLPAAGRYELFCIATVQDLARGEGFMLTSAVLPELKIDVRKLF